MEKEDDEDYRSIMNWLEKADLRESIINDKLYYWNINFNNSAFQGIEDNSYNMKEQKKEEIK